MVRIISGLVMLPVVLGSVFYGEVSYLFLMLAIIIIGMGEWARMVEPRITKFSYYLSILTAFVSIITFYSAINSNIWGLILLLLGISSYLVNQLQGGRYSYRLIFGLVYLTMAVNVMLWIRLESEAGLFYTLLMFFIVWSSDIGAYFSGKLIGGPKLAPKISPNKTWAGFIGSSVWAGLICFIMMKPEVLEYFSDKPEAMQQIPLWCIVALGGVLAMFGQAGDLFISSIKRHYGLKDTGNVIPGHGGILDRVDALLLVSLVYAGVLRFIGG